MNSHNNVYITSETLLEDKVTIFKKTIYCKKLRVHNAHAKRKRCYDVMLSRQEGSTTHHLASAQCWAGLAGGNTGRLFLTFGGPVRADRISIGPLDRMY